MHTEDITGVHDRPRGMTFDVRVVVASTFVIVVLAVQAYVGFTRHDSYYWPITSYPMYSQARYDGDRLGYYSLYAEAEDMSRVEVLPHEVGLRYWGLVRNVISPLRRAPEIAAVQVFKDLYCVNGRKEFQLVVFDRGGHISHDGPVFTDPMELARHTVTCGA